MLKLGEKIISDIYLGDKKIAKVLLGNKLVYQSSNLVDWVQPVLTSNGVMGGDSFAVDQSSSFNNWDFYLVFEGTRAWHSDAGLPQWVSWYNPKPLIVKKLTFGAVAEGTITTGYVQASDDNINWFNLTSFNNTNPTGTFEIDLSNNFSGYKYYRIYITGCGYKIGSTYYALIAKGFKITAQEVEGAQPKPKFVDYIKSTGGAYINTGLKPSYGYTIKTKYQYTGLSVTYNPIFGMRTSAVPTGNGVFWAGMHYTTNEVYLRFGGNSVNHSLGDKALDVIEMTCSPQGIFINGVDTGARYYNGQIATDALETYLFTINPTTANLGETNARVFSYEVYDSNNVLIQNLKPCIAPNGEIAMYDTVTRRYYFNAGTGKLIASPRFVTSILFDGASYIDTGIAHQTCTVECDIRFENTGTRQLMGFGTGSGQYWGAGATGIFDYMSGTNALDRTLVVIDFNAEQINYTIYADGKSRTSASGNALSSHTYRIGAGPTGASSNSYWCTCEVWGNKFTNANGELIQDLRPYVDADGVACFKDVVTGNLFYNKGTGTLGYMEK